MLSKDIVTNFRDRGSEIKVYPLSFKEFYPVSGLEKVDAMEEYLTYGGMPLAVLEKNETEKRKYLKGLHKRVYILKSHPLFKLQSVAKRMESGWGGFIILYHPARSETFGKIPNIE